MLLCSITRLPAWKRKGTYLRENNPALPQKHLHLPHPPDLAAALSLALWTCVMQATRRLLRIPRASSGPVGACCSTPGANSNTQWLHKVCVRVCSPKALGRWARSRWHGTNAGEKTFRPSLGCICCIRPSFVCLGKNQRALVVICLAIDTHYRLCRTAITHSHANLPATRAMPEGSVAAAISP